MIDSTAVIDPTVTFRQHDGAKIQIAERVNMWRNCELCGPISIGPGSFFNRDVYIRPFTTIEDNVSVDPFVRFITDSHEVSNVKKRAGKPIYLPIRVCQGSWIGAGAMILGGVTIGKGAIVGAGAVITRDVSPNTLVAGVPGVAIRQLNPLETELQDM